MRARLAALPAIIALALATACGSSAPADPAGVASASAMAAAPAAAGGTTAAPAATATRTSAPTKLLVIVEENHAEVPALSQMPYLRTLAHRFGYTTGYHAITHPSLPNYLVLAGGSTFGVTDDAYPSAHAATGRSIFDQAIAAKRRGRAYVESMPTPCLLVSAGRYAVKHNPWAYFNAAASRAACAHEDVPAGTVDHGALRSDITSGRLPAVGMVVPDICDDGHDCSLQTSDTWLHRWLPLVQAGPDWKAGRLVVVVTFDEDDHSDSNRVLTVVLSPALHGRVVASRLTHCSITRAAAEVLKVRPLGCGAAAPSLLGAFGLSVSSRPTGGR